MPLSLLLLAFLVLNAWTMPRMRWQWKLQLITLEFGHWLALASGTLAVSGILTLVRPTAGSHAYPFGGLGAAAGFEISLTVAQTMAYAVLACVFLIPALQAARIARREGLRFSWLRLWLPITTGAFKVTRSRVTYWQNGPDALDLVIHRPLPPNASSVASSTGPPALRPCLLIAHTGGWDSGDPGEFRFANAEIASHGYVVCNFGYRLAPKHRWPAQAEDTRRALAWVRDHASELGIDIHRIVLMGRSAGAQIAVACAYSMPELNVRACISVYGPPNMHLAREWSLPNDILKSLTLVRQYMGGDPHEVPEIYRTASASEFVDQHRLPTLLIHGARDTLVDIRHSRFFTQRVGPRDDYHFLELPWGTHGTDYFPSTPGGQLSISAILRVMQRFA